MLESGMVMMPQKKWDILFFLTWNSSQTYDSELNIMFRSGRQQTFPYWKTYDVWRNIVSIDEQNRDNRQTASFFCILTFFQWWRTAYFSFPIMLFPKEKTKLFKRTLLPQWDRSSETMRRAIHWFVGFLLMCFSQWSKFIWHLFFSSKEEKVVGMIHCRSLFYRVTSYMFLILATP
jgi:hypothetical protein